MGPDARLRADPRRDDDGGGGVYLVARMYGFYALSPTALAVIAFIGGFTALFAATGLVKDELKQVLAYSTISQYGYMMRARAAAGTLRRSST